jgi:hypothetical protein
MHTMTKRVYEFITKHPELDPDWKFGGDGDDGEYMLTMLDEFFSQDEVFGAMEEVAVEANEQYWRAVLNDGSY